MFASASIIMELILLEAISAELEANLRKRRRRFLVNRRIDQAMELPDEEFLEHFRITKEMFVEIMNLTEDALPDSDTACGYPKPIQVLSVLSWLANGHIEDVLDPGVPIESSTNSMCRMISQVIPILEEKLGSAFIQWPRTLSQRKSIKEGFYAKRGIPSTIGIIDCMHVEIKKPDKAHQCLNQYDKYSLSVSLICDHEGKFIAADATYGGATHSSDIWNMSHERAFMEKIYNENREKCWILGNKAYHLEPWLISPYRTTTQEDIEFNKKFSAVHAIMSRNLGILRSRWKILTKKLLCTPNKTSKIAYLCVALHNMCKMRNVPDVRIERSVQEMQDREEIIEVDEAFDEENEEDQWKKGAANRELIKQILT
ncbi:putative nuclease HARBI1 [Lutzomyia longipalpis]|uniref:putative nuclease HARBI1 n=1 Tax=Lutzomyia longipalpis TaxID=7200 RepID=UPI0024844E5F|nr:putative nuclease HARBI1 [Lutzomyia longipalpis]